MDEKINPNFTYLKERIEEDRWILLQGSTRSGKTWSIIHWIVNFCYLHNNSGIEIDVVRNTFKALKNTFWKDFKTALLELEIWDDSLHHKTDHTYYLYGNVINYYGADDPEKVHGRSRDILILNEANQIEEETLDQLTPRTRYRIICDFNPALGLDHWLDNYIEKYGVLITTYKDNPFLTTSQIEDIESRKDNPYWWAIYGEGQRAKVQGVVFENWKEGELDLVDSWFGMDFGFSNDPTTVVQISIDKKKKVIYAKELLYSTHLNTSQIVDFCLQKAQGVIIADSAEPRLIKEMRDKGVNVQGAKKVTINEGVMMMNDYQMIIQGENLKKELSRYKWADKGKTIPVDRDNHLIDALRYAFMWRAARPNYGKYAVG